jgi:hypothetical protein
MSTEGYGLGQSGVPVNGLVIVSHKTLYVKLRI